MYAVVIKAKIQCGEPEWSNPLTENVKFSMWSKKFVNLVYNLLGNMQNVQLVIICTVP